MGNRYLGITFLMTAAAALSGCDNKPAQSKPKAAIHMKFQLDKTHSATIGADLPDHMPAYAKVYPGADVQGVVDLTSAGMGWVVNYTVPARPKDVLDFYKKNSAAEGLETKNDSVIGQAFDFSARKNDAYVSVMIDGKDGGTFVQLKYK